MGKRHTADAVSYTHLDVYKRQIHAHLVSDVTDLHAQSVNGCHDSVGRGIQGGCKRLDVKTVALQDVYKRQLMGCVGNSRQLT